MQILTELALVTCDHSTGVVANVPSQNVVSICGGRVLVGNDPAGKAIAGCTNVSTTIKPCTSTLNVEQGKSTFVTINGKPVCMNTVVGGTDGTPPSVTKYRVKFPGQILVEIQA